jgi:hypothetical protein
METYVEDVNMEIENSTDFEETNDFELLSVYMDFIQKCACEMSIQKCALILTYIQSEYECISDTTLGDFINHVALIIKEIRDREGQNCDNLHQVVQDCIDDADLNDELLLTVGHGLLNCIEHFDQVEL